MRFLTAGESHGKALTVIIEGMPAGLEMDLEFISKRLALRRSGYGRGGRMKIETDSPILTGEWSTERPQVLPELFVRKQGSCQMERCSCRRSRRSGNRQG